MPTKIKLLIESDADTFLKTVGIDTILLQSFLNWIILNNLDSNCKKTLLKIKLKRKGDWFSYRDRIIFIPVLMRKKTWYLKGIFHEFFHMIQSEYYNIPFETMADYLYKKDNRYIFDEEKYRYNKYEEQCRKGENIYKSFLLYEKAYLHSKKFWINEKTKK